MLNEALSKLRSFRPKVEPMPALPRVTGTIKKFIPEIVNEETGEKDKGFGFIAVKGQPDMYFFHQSYFGENFDVTQIKENLDVEFTPNKGQNGLRAFDVVLVSEDTTAVPVDEEQEEGTLLVADPIVYANEIEGFVDLKVRSITPAKQLAGSVVAHIMKGERVRLLAIGHGAVAQAVKSIPIASGRTVGNGFMLATVPSFDVRSIESENGPTERTLTILQIIKIKPV